VELFISREAATAERRYEKERQSGSYVHMTAFSARTYLLSLYPPCPRVGKNPGFFKKAQPSGFFWVFFGFFLGFLGFFGFFWFFLPRREGF
jgi:hypothetical protein